MSEHPGFPSDGVLMFVGRYLASRSNVSTEASEPQRGLGVNLSSPTFQLCHQGQVT